MELRPRSTALGRCERHYSAYLIAVVLLHNSMNILDRLKEQAANAPRQVVRSSTMPWYDPGPPILPKATSEQILEAERKLGFTLPPLLKSIYLEIGNGGWLVGPGIYGIGSDSDSSPYENAVAASLGMADEMRWWRDYLVIADQGCSMYSCIDCSDPSFGVYRLDGNAYTEQSIDHPTNDFWYLEAETLEDWFTKDLEKKLKKTRFAVPSSPLNTQQGKAPWWRLW